MTEAAVTIGNLGYGYTAGTWVLRGLSAHVARGTVFAILGPNGRGKTTLLHLLLGALKPREGTIVVAGRTAFVPQLFQVSFDYSVLDMVLMGRARKIGLFAQPSRADEEAARAALDRFGLADRVDQPFHELSGGQRQLTIFARALVAEADVLVLDEPTSALDLKNQALVLDWIGTLSRRDGLTVIFTTHHPHHALAVADAAMLMQSTHDHAVGPAADVLTEDELTALYDVPMRKIGFEHEGRRLTTFAPVLTGSRTQRPL